MASRRVAVVAGAGTGVGKWLPRALRLMDSVSSTPLKFSHHEYTEGGVIREADAALFGSVVKPTSGQKEKYVSPIVSLRQKLNLFAVVYPLVDDVLLVREATECLYVGRERMEGDVAVAERHISPLASRQVAQLAFDLALKRRMGDDEVQDEFKRSGSLRKPASVTVAHKINMLPLTEGVFLGAARAVAEQYRGKVAMYDIPADTLAAGLVSASDRRKLDVVLTTNLFGDLLGDVGAGISGGLSRMAAASMGQGGWVLAHGSNLVSGADDHPAALVRACSIVLGSLGEQNAAAALEKAVATILNKTEDLSEERFFDEVAAAADYELHLMDVSQGS